MGTAVSLADLRPAAPTITANVRAGFFDAAGFELMQRVSKAFAASTLVPPQYQGNLANCMIAINMAERIGADPMMVMQNLYIVHGRPGWSAQFLIATFNHCGRFTAIRYEWFGDRGKDSWGCRAYATEKGTDEKIVGPDITIDLAKKEQWHDKAGSKWKTIPQLMLMYRAAAWLIRTYAPEIAMGLQTAEELGDVIDVSRQADGTFESSLDALRKDDASLEAVAISGGDGVTIPPEGTPAAGLARAVADIRSAIERATTVDQVQLQQDMARNVRDDKLRAELETAAHGKLKELGESAGA